MQGKGRSHRLGIGLPPARRTLHIREQKRHRPGRATTRQSYALLTPQAWGYSTKPTPACVSPHTSLGRPPPRPASRGTEPDVTKGHGRGTSALEGASQNNAAGPTDERHPPPAPSYAISLTMRSWPTFTYPATPGVEHAGSGARGPTTAGVSWCWCIHPVARLALSSALRHLRLGGFTGRYRVRSHIRRGSTVRTRPRPASKSKSGSVRAWILPLVIAPPMQGVAGIGCSSWVKAWRLSTSGDGTWCGRRSSWSRCRWRR